MIIIILLVNVIKCHVLGYNTNVFLFKFFVNTEGTRSIPRSFVDLYGIEQEVAIETSI